MSDPTLIAQPVLMARPMRTRAAHRLHPRRYGPELLIYVALLLFALLKAADHFAPWHSLSQAGCTVTYVYDGDTVELTCTGQTRTARLLGYDTPETRDARCPAEEALGRRATLALRAAVAGGDVALSDHGRDKYGRTLARLSIRGRDAADLMIAQGLAVPYAGGNRPDWCARLAQGPRP